MKFAILILNWNGWWDTIEYSEGIFRNLFPNHQVIIITKVIVEIVNEYKKLITFVKDRRGRERRYALCTEKIGEELNYKPHFEFKESLVNTVKWYIENYGNI
jgi:dTDP-D-glucose 4,6-dehydratase